MFFTDQNFIDQNLKLANRIIAYFIYFVKNDFDYERLLGVDFFLKLVQCATENHMEMLEDFEETVILCNNNCHICSNLCKKTSQSKFKYTNEKSAFWASVLKYVISSFQVHKYFKKFEHLFELKFEHIFWIKIIINLLSTPPILFFATATITKQ